MKLVKSEFLFVFILFSNLLICQKGVLHKYDFSEPAKQIYLDSQLNEISGLSLSENKLYAHNDEISTIFEIDKSSGEILNKFHFGMKSLKGDYEDLVIVENNFFVIESNGNLYSFSNPGNDKISECFKIKTGLKSKNDIEGIEFLEKQNSFLLLCKESAGKGYKGKRAIYEFNPKTNELKKTPEFLIDLKKIKRLTGRKNFNPSALKKTKEKTLLILDGKGKTLIEIDLSGEILSAVKLNKKLHKQPEGIEILNNGTIIISDEAVKGRPTLTYYQK